MFQFVSLLQKQTSESKSHTQTRNWGFELWRRQPKVVVDDFLNLIFKDLIFLYLFPTNFALNYSLYRVPNYYDAGGSKIRRRKQ